MSQDIGDSFTRIYCLVGVDSGMTQRASCFFMYFVFIGGQSYSHRISPDSAVNMIVNRQKSLALDRRELDHKKRELHPRIGLVL